ncbi:MAG: HYR domain-containing protein [Bacteroidetes bacterium]|nr:HYR domain-containing protein [Bacteroidota bacterium]
MYQKANFVRLLILFLSLLISVSVSGQPDKRHYIPPFFTIAGEIGDHFLFISTESDISVPVQVKDGAGNTLFFGSVVSGAPATIHLGTNPGTGYIPLTAGSGNILTNLSQLNTITTDGLIVEATRPVYANVRHLTNNHGTSCTTKGSVALGQAFRAGMVIDPMVNSPNWRNCFISVIATEDNTTVTFSDFKPGVVFTNLPAAGNPLTTLNNSINLQENESYTIGITADQYVAQGATADLNDAIGTLITSNKPIAVSSGSFKGGPDPAGASRDIGVDQLIPLNYAGIEHIVIKGGAPNTSPLESVCVVATQSSTNFFLNGSATPYNPSPMNAGDYIWINGEYSAQNNMYILGNKPILVYQNIGGSSSIATPGLNVIPPLNLVEGVVVKDIAESDFLGTADIGIITRTGATVTINGAPPSASPQAVPGTSQWVTYKESNVSGTLGLESDEPLLVGLFNVNSAVGATGFFAGRLDCGLRIDSTSVVNNSCPGQFDGTIDIYLSGGQPDYSYSLNYGPWLPVSGNSFQLTNLPPGSYILDVEDKVGCSRTELLFLDTEPPTAINLSGQNTPISNGDVFPTTVDGTDFGQLEIGAFLDREFVIKNDGLSDLDLDAPPFADISGSSAFSILNVSGSSPVAPGDSITLTIRFAPLSLGFESANVTIASDDCDDPIFLFAIQGMSVCPTITAEIAGDTSICGEASLPIDILIEGGFGPYTVQLFDGNQTLTFNNVQSSDQILVEPDSSTQYELTLVVDNFQCPVISEGSVLVAIFPNPEYVASAADASCPNTMDGQILIDSLAGSLPFTYSIDGGQTYEPNGGSSDTYLIGDLPAGIYDLIILDENECSATESLEILAIDDTPPLLTCLTDTLMLELDTAGQASLSAEDLILDVSDNCALDTTTISNTEFDCADAGSIFQIDLSAFDENQNQSNCSAFVQIGLPDSPPVIECPADTTINLTDSCEILISWVEPDMQQGICGAYTLAEASATPGSLFEPGTTTVSYLYENPEGSQSTCTFEITVVDAESPQIDCPPDQTIDLAPDDPNCSLIVDDTFLDALASDNCTFQLVHDYAAAPSSSSLAFAEFPTGSTTISWIATDDSGNQTSCSLVLSLQETNPPQITCLTDTLFVDTDPGSCTATVNWLSPNAEDNCLLAGVQQTTGPLNGSLVEAGAAEEIIYLASDASGNTMSCSFFVQVLDQEAPEFAGSSLPENMTVECDAVPVADLDTSDFIDNCSDQSELEIDFQEISTQGDNANTCPNFNYNLQRTWTISDASGNIWTHIQDIEVISVSDWAVSFPEDWIGDCPAGQASDFGEPELFFESCELTGISWEDSIQANVPDACYNIFRNWTVINWCTFDESAGNVYPEIPEDQYGSDLDNDGDQDNRTFRESVNPQAEADGIIQYTQLIKILSAEAPPFTLDIIEDCTGLNGCSVNLLIPVLSDWNDCYAQATVDIEGDLGSYQNLTEDLILENTEPGNYQITYTFTDICGNSSTEIVEVIVADCETPTAVCPEELTVYLGAGGMLELSADQLDAGSFDNCSSDLNFSFSINLNDQEMVLNCDDWGWQNQNLWITDESGNQSNCSIELLVLEDGNACPNLTDISGAIYRENGIPVDDAWIGVSGIGPFGPTQPDGLYTVNLPTGGDYQLTPTESKDWLEGVTTYDLYLISLHILGVTPFDSPYKRIAADANNSGSITTLDIIALRKLILQYYDSLPQNSSWRFVDASYTFPNPEDPWLEEFPEWIFIEDLQNPVQGADFTGIKIGDVQ